MGMDHGLTGYTVRNPTNNRVSDDAVALVQKLPSVGELFLTNGTDFAREFADEISITATDSAECEDAVYEFAISDDGFALITKCASAARHLDVPDQLAGAPVRVIASHAFSTCYKLESINLPDDLEQIHGYAFMNTALHRFCAPSHLMHIGVKAFYKCLELHNVQLNEGLLSIGDSAFRESGLQSIEIPSTTLVLGQGIFDGTGVSCGNVDPCLRINADNPRFFLIGGVIYERCEDGLSLVQFVDEAIDSYVCPEEIEGALVRIDDRAFAGKKKLKSIELPEGVRSIGEAAFRGCTSLVHVGLPDTLESLGFRAFWETTLQDLYIPLALDTIGIAALHTGGTMAGSHAPTIKSVAVAEDNERFYLYKGLLCERKPDGGVVVLLYTGQDNPNGEVEIPREVTAIGPYAFSNAKGIRSLRFHSGVATIDISGFGFGAIVPEIIYDDLETGKSYTIMVPPSSRGYTAMRQSFNRGTFDLETAYELLDRATSVTQDMLGRSRIMLARIKDPVLAQPEVVQRFRNSLRGALEKIVVVFGRNGYPQGIDQLLETGILDAGNIESAIEAAQAAGEIAVLSRLMEIRRTEFGAALFDFDL